MSRYECVEDRVVKNADRSFIICQVVPSRFVVIVENKFASSSDDSLRGLCHSKTINFVESWAIKCLNRGKCPHIPHTEHTRNIGRYNLVGAWHPFYAH